MIHYHGLPITPEVIIAQAMQGAHFFLSFEYPDQLATAATCGASFAADNGAFSKWKAGGKDCDDWSPYYAWIESIRRNPKFDFAVIPDVIEGCEEDNDALLDEWPFNGSVGAPVWHLHESLDRLKMLCGRFERVCLGSSGAFAKIATPAWWNRMNAAMDAICDSNGVPAAKLHGLRMLDAELIVKFPFKSCDSTNVARNVGIDCRWSGTYQPPTKAARAAVLRARIESALSPCAWQGPVDDGSDFRFE